MPQVPETIPPIAAPRASMTDQVVAPRAFAAPNPPGETISGKNRGASRDKEAADTHLDRSQRVEEPDMLGIPDEKEPEDGYGPADVRQDEQVLTTVAVGDDSGDRTYQERCQHPDYEKAPNGEAGPGQEGDQ